MSTVKPTPRRAIDAMASGAIFRAPASAMKSPLPKLNTATKALSDLQQNSATASASRLLMPPQLLQSPNLDKRFKTLYQNSPIPKVVKDRLDKTVLLIPQDAQPLDRSPAAAHSDSVGSPRRIDAAAPARANRSATAANGTPSQPSSSKRGRSVPPHPPPPASAAPGSPLPPAKGNKGKFPSTPERSQAVHSPTRLAPGSASSRVSADMDIEVEGDLPDLEGDEAGKTQGEEGDATTEKPEQGLSKPVQGLVRAYPVADTRKRTKNMPSYE